MYVVPVLFSSLDLLPAFLELSEIDDCHASILKGDLLIERDKRKERHCIVESSRWNVSPADPGGRWFM